MRHRTLLLLATTLSSMLLAASTLAILAADSHSIYLPALSAGSGGGISGLQIQNIGEESARLDIDLFDREGVRQSIHRPNVPDRSATNVYLGRGDWPGRLMSGIASSDQPIAAIVRTDWSRSGAAAIYSNAQASHHVVVPLVTKRHIGQCTVLAVQNTDRARDALIEFELDALEPALPDLFHFRVAAGTAKLLDLCDDPELASIPDGYLGSARLRSGSSRIAVQSHLFFASNRGIVTGFEGLPIEQASDRLFAPLIRNHYFGTTGISVVNPSAQAVSVTLTYVGSPLTPQCEGRTVHGGGPAEIAARSSLVFYQGGSTPDTPDPNLPVGCLGSAIIESTGKVIAMVHDSDLKAGTTAAYLAVSEARGARRVAIPLYRDRHTEHRLSTGIQVMNIGQEPAEVSLTLASGLTAATIDREIEGCGRDCAALIEPMGTHTWYPPSISGVNGHRSTVGSALLQGDQPIVAIVNDASELGTVDSAIYNGIPID